MIDVKTKKEVKPTMKAHPRETVRWTRPDGWQEYHRPHGEPMKLMPPRGGRGFGEARAPRVQTDKQGAGP